MTKQPIRTTPDHLRNTSFCGDILTDYTIQTFLHEYQIFPSEHVYEFVAWDRVKGEIKKHFNLSLRKSSDNDTQPLEIYLHKTLKFAIYVCPLFGKHSFTTKGGESFVKSDVVKILMYYDVFDKKANDIIQSWSNFSRKKDAKAQSISFVTQGQFGFYLKERTISQKIEMDLETNYGDKFLPVHQKIQQFLQVENENGLILLYGTPGSGKSSYLRFLLSDIATKCIYLPSQIVATLGNPALIDFLLDQENFVLFIEDAEEVLMRRSDTANNSAVVNLLNLSDGILGASTKAKVICTFNCELNNIDPALKRKGRLKYQHEFTALSIDQSDTLMQKLGKTGKATAPMTLAEIYNLEDDNNAQEQPKRQIGFAV